VPVHQQRKHPKDNALRRDDLYDRQDPSGSQREKVEDQYEYKKGIQ
jgi:hypothetical protein